MFCPAVAAHFLTIKRHGTRQVAHLLEIEFAVNLATDDLPKQGRFTPFFRRGPSPERLAIGLGKTDGQGRIHGSRVAKCTTICKTNSVLFHPQLFSLLLSAFRSPPSGFRFPVSGFRFFWSGIQLKPTAESCHHPAVRPSFHTDIPPSDRPTASVIVRASHPIPNHRRAFTLLELMVVIGIIAVMLVALIPAVSSLTKSSGRKAAVGSLLGGIEQARANAIKTGQASYIVFPTFTAGSKTTLDQYDHKSFAIFEDDPANPTTPKQLIGWKRLPTGVSLRAKAASQEALSNLPDAAGLTPPLTFSFSPDAAATPLFRCIKFNSNGEIESPPAKVALAVFEGYVNAGAEVVTGTKTGGGEPAAREAINVARLTGRAERAQ